MVPLHHPPPASWRRDRLLFRVRLPWPCLRRGSHSHWGTMNAAQFKSRDDHRRERELEEARKAGTIPAERDAEGNEINPHIPQYMAQAPWYLNQDGPGLGHTKNWKGKEKVATASDFIPKGLKAGPAATVFRKG
eukprot:1295089-Prymnesium_polylepis.1